MNTTYSAKSNIFYCKNSIKINFNGSTYLARMMARK